jgi:LysM repeat protein
MVKKHLILFLLIAAALPAQAETVPSVGALGPSGKKLQQATDLERSSKYLEARDAYQALLKEPGLSKKKSTQIRKKIENLNVKILFSPLPMPESIIHEVVPGDALYKLAKKHGTTMELIKKSNNLQSEVIKTGQKLKIFTGTFSIKVEKKKNLMTLYMNHKAFKHYRVATGLEGGTPTGEFKVINRIENPTWYKTGAVVPPGDPKNYLGTRWIGLDTPGYGIHGTTEPESIGTQSTSGCVRMLNKEVEELYIMIPQGTVVKIVE